MLIGLAGTVALCEGRSILLQAAFLSARSFCCALLPSPLLVFLGLQVPQAAEQGEVERLHRAVTLIQQCWRRYCARKALAQSSSTMRSGSDAAPAAAAVLAGLGRDGSHGPPRRLDSMLAAVDTVEGGDPYGRVGLFAASAGVDPASLSCLCCEAPCCPPSGLSAAAAELLCLSATLPAVLPSGLLQASRGSLWMSW